MADLEAAEQKLFVRMLMPFDHFAALRCLWRFPSAERCILAILNTQRRASITGRSPEKYKPTRMGGTTVRNIYGIRMRPSSLPPRCIADTKLHLKGMLQIIQGIQKYFQQAILSEQNIVKNINEPS
ncbi:hypothetical protein JTB14_028996 [Gonioctena quinquepunctata]|nr:hypothetical protein JTB14_028996 [Gonioctena quinquepunctata]